MEFKRKNNTIEKIKKMNNVKNVKRLNMQIIQFELYGCLITCKYEKAYQIITYFNKVLDEINKHPQILESIEFNGSKIILNIEEMKHRYQCEMTKYLFKLPYADKFKQTVENNGHKLLSPYINATNKVLIDFNCGHDPNWISPNAYLSRKARCPYCAGNKIIPFKTDCYTVRKDLLKYFINPEDAIGISAFDRTKRKYICPNCNKTKITDLSNINCFGFSCDYCGDGISYGEKLFQNVLNELNVDYEMHKNFKWCNYEINGISHKGYYDFVIEDKKIIFEINGRQHYADAWHSLSETQYIDKQKYDLAIKNGYRLYTINYSYDNYNIRFNILKNNIIDILSKFYNLDNINWDTIKELSLTSRVLQTINLWNKGYSVGQITQLLKTNNTSVISYLKQGAELNLCNYTPKNRQTA